jgi:O-antigen/teichoic acid export membrane protein/GT2 family glycosyltransferase
MVIRIIRGSSNSERMTKKKPSLVENIVSLGIVQGAEYLIPLIAVPFLLRVVGAEGYGHIAFVQALCMYFVVFTEFGFNLTATRLASIHHGERDTLSAIFWEVQAVKATLCILATVVLGVLVLSIASLKTIWPVVMLGLLPVLGSVLYPLWLLQGLERMRETALIMIGVRLSLLACLFLLVNERDDLPLAAALQMGARPIAGLVSWTVLARSRQIRWVRPNLARSWERLAESRHAFFVTSASTLYRSTNAVVLGFLAGPLAVAHYSVAEKVVKAVQELSRPIAQAAYPRVTALAASSREAAMPLLRWLLLVIGALGLCTSLGLFVMAEVLARVLGGVQLLPAADVLRMMAFVPLVGGINAVLGIQTMMAFGYGKAFSRCVACAGVFNLLAVVPLSFWLGDRGAALSYFLSELILLVSMAAFLRSRGVRYFARSAPLPEAIPVQAETHACGPGGESERRSVVNPSPGGTVCAVCVTYGKRWHFLREALASARQEGVARAVVVDNGSQEDIQALASAEFGDFVEVVRMGRNTGSAGGFKAGISRALARGSDFLLLLDDDNRLEPGCLVRLSDAHAEAAAMVPVESLAVLAYRDRYADIAARVATASAMSAHRSAFFGFRIEDVPFKLFRRTRLGRRWITRRASPAPVTMSVAPYSGLFFHRSMPQMHGLPDDRFVLYADDTDFSYRVTRGGGQIILVPEARLGEMELSWNVKARFGNTFDGLLLGDGDFRAFYWTRNIAYFERWSRGSRGLLRSINRGLYLSALWLRAAMLRRGKRLDLLMQAIRDGEAGRLGEHREFPL